MSIEHNACAEHRVELTQYQDLDLGAERPRKYNVSGERRTVSATAARSRGSGGWCCWQRPRRGEPSEGRVESGPGHEWVIVSRREAHCLTVETREGLLLTPCGVAQRDWSWVPEAEA